jgi:photosystem II stability/assembly factor-like uncharacterized protein
MFKKMMSTYLVVVFFVTLIITQISPVNISTAKQIDEDLWIPSINGIEGGCITSIISDPGLEDHFFAGTAEHGVFETEDAGESWTSISKNLENKMVTALFLYKKTLYVGTNQDLYRTDNKGKTWEKADKKFPKIYCIMICGDMIYLGTNQGLYKSQDKHNSFKLFEITDPEIKGIPVFTVVTHGLNPSAVFIGTQDKGVFGTVNGGANWFRINNSLPQQSVNKLVIDPKTGTILYALLEEQGMWKYEVSDSGVKNNSKDWEKLNDLKDIQVQNAIITDKSDEIYLGTRKDGAYLFKIESRQLSKLPIPEDYFGITSLAIKDNKIIIGTAGKGCLCSYDRGKTWIESNYGINAVNINQLIIDPKDHNKRIASSFGCIFITTNKGLKWEKVMKGLPEAQLTCIAFLPQDSQYLLAGTEESGLYESFDGGYNWSKNIALTYSRITCLLTDPGSTGGIYVGTLAKGIYFSNDKGKTWSTLDLGTEKDQKGASKDYITTLCIDPTDSNIIYAGTNINGIYQSLDKGKTWAHITEGLGKNYFINDIQVAKSDNKVIYAGIKIINEGGFIKSVDQGKTWKSTNLYGGGMVFRSLSIDQLENSIVFAGTADGVFYTKDTGFHWYNYDNGLDKENKLYLNQFPINQMIQDPDQDNKLIITTRWGIYESIKSRKILDKIPPKIVLEEPLSNQIYTSSGQVSFVGKVIDEFGIEYIKVNDNPIEFDKASGSFSFDRDLRLGENEYLIQARDISQNDSELKVIVFLDQTMPELGILSPLPYSDQTVNNVLIKGNAVDRESGIDKLLINNIEFESGIRESDGYFEYNYQGLTVGKNEIEVKLIDKAGNLIKKNLVVNVAIEDSIPPTITLVNPDKDLTYTNVSQLAIEGIVTDDKSGIFRLKVNNSNVEWDKNGKFIYRIDLKQGKNDFVITASDLKGNETSKEFAVVLDSIEPKIVPSNLAIDNDTNTSIKNFIVKFTVTDEGLGLASVQLYLNNKIQNDLQEPKETIFEIPIVLTSGISHLQILATDKIGNKSEFKAIINYDPPVLIQLQIGNNKVQITRDENTIEKTIDVAPMIYQKRTMVPLRFLSEAFDATVTWLPKPIEEAKIAYQNKFTIYLKPWNPIARIEYPAETGKPPEKITMDAPPIISNNRTLVPLRFISDMFGAKVDWEAKTQTIKISLSKY